MEHSKPEIRDVVTYRDSLGDEHRAFVTAAGGEGPNPPINLVYVSSDTKKLDGYGRATLHATFVRHASERMLRGICWRRCDEELGPEPAAEPHKPR